MPSPALEICTHRKFCTRPAFTRQRAAIASRATDWNRLHAAIHEILEPAIRYEGSTLADGTYRNALNQSGGYQNHHRVYDRAGLNLPHLRPGPHSADRAGSAVHLFLPGLPKPVARRGFFETSGRFGGLMNVILSNFWDVLF